MSFDALKKRTDRRQFYVVEIDIDYCANTYGISPCTASTANADNKCFNTLSNCQDKPNFTKTTKTLRFCEDISPLPKGVNAIPCVESVSLTPSKIDIKGGLGTRSSVNLTFSDFPHSDIGIDKYVTQRSWIASERGTFWTKFRARNPNYQFRALRLLSGYLTDNNEYKAENFETRHYVIESLNVYDGKATLKASDPLKKAMQNKAQAPKASTGKLASDINATATTATLTPTGIGDSEYPASGKVLIGKEVIAFTRSGDSLTLTRGQNNTTAASHNADDSVQLCLEYNDQVNNIVSDLLINYADIDSSLLDLQAWQTEIDTFNQGLLQGIIVKPTDVKKLLIELAEAAPHYLWWDEKSQKIQLTSIKEPPQSASVLTDDGHIISNSIKITDKTDERISTVLVNFGQYDPTEKIDEVSNYAQSYVRIDSDSVAKYGSNEIKVINSRWINNFNKGRAVSLAALIGRRFANVPREISFALDDKDSDVWLGQTRAIEHQSIVDATGAKVPTLFQITSSQQSADGYKYTGLEFAFGDELPQDLGGTTTNNIYLPTARNVNLRAVYDSLNPPPTTAVTVNFIVDNGVVIGATSNSITALDTGTFPAGSVIKLIVSPNAYVVGKGGDGGTSGNGQNGGDAIILNHDLIIVNNGIIGGGGGGGASESDTSTSPTSYAGGGGGAGDDIGKGGASFSKYSGKQDGLDSSITTGGTGGFTSGASGGNGGDLGQNGENTSSATGGLAGKAIVKNGKTLTLEVAGDIRGSVV